jgi:hypothetical protein
VTIYECVPSGAIEVLHVYVDPDPEEMHYTCAWSYEPATLQPILAVAGRNGVVRLLRCVHSGCCARQTRGQACGSRGVTVEAARG